MGHMVVIKIKKDEAYESEYAEWRKRELGDDADRPHKTIYRKLVRS